MLNAARARRQQQSGWLTQAPDMLGAGLRDTKTILPAACGDLLTYADARASANPAVVDPVVRPRLAHMLASAWAQRVNVANPDMELAKMIGELTVGWSSEFPGTVAGMTAAQAVVLNTLRANILESQTLLLTVRSIYTSCRAAVGTGTVPAADFAPFAPVPAVANVSKVFFEFFCHGGHLILNNFLENDTQLEGNSTSRDLWTLLKAPAQQDPDLPDVALLLAADVQTPYSGQTFNQMMGFWECVEYHNLDLAKKRILGAAAVFVTAACKGGNETEGYISRRTTIFETQFPGLDIQGIFKSEVIRAFCDLYMNQEIAVNTLYKALMPLYSSFGQTKLQCLAWMIEQAIGANCTSVVAFAEAVIEQNYRPLQILLKRLSLGQWQNFVSMCYVIIRNPWGQIRNPKYPASMYKDITNYGRYARKKQDSKFTPYAGGFLAGGELTERQIKQIYETCKEQSDLASSAEMDLGTEIRALLPAVEVRVDDDYVYLYDGTDNPINLDQLIERANRRELGAARVPQRANVAANNAQAAQPEGGQGGGNQPNAGAEAANADGAGNLEQPMANLDINPFLPQAQPAPIPDAYLTLEEREARQEAERRRMAAIRSDWSGRMKNLPKSAIRLNMADAIHVIQARLSVDPKYQGVKDLLSQVRTAVSQEVLTPWTRDNDVSLRTRYRPATDAIRATIRSFNLNPQDIVPDHPEDDVTEDQQAYDGNAMDVISMWSRPPRAIV